MLNEEIFRLEKVGRSKGACTVEKRGVIAHSPHSALPWHKAGRSGILFVCVGLILNRLVEDIGQ